MNLLDECLKKQKVQKMYNDFCEENKQEEFLPTSGYEYAYETYKVYSPKVVKMLIELREFIEKRLITYDYELISLLKYNNALNSKYIKLVINYVDMYTDSFVESVSNSILDTAKKIQFCRLSAFKQRNLVEYDEFYKACAKNLKN